MYSILLQFCSNLYYLFFSSLLSFSLLFSALLCFTVLFCSIVFYCILFYSILFSYAMIYFGLFCSNLFFFIPLPLFSLNLLDSTRFCYVLFCRRLNVLQRLGTQFLRISDSKIGCCSNIDLILFYWNMPKRLLYLFWKQ